MSLGFDQRFGGEGSGFEKPLVHGEKEPTTHPDDAAYSEKYCSGLPLEPGESSVASFDSSGGAHTSDFESPRAKDEGNVKNFSLCGKAVIKGWTYGGIASGQSYGL